MKKINLLYILLLSLTIGCNKDYVQETHSEALKAKRVTLKALEPVNDPISIHASGLLQSDTEITLSFKTGGIVNAVNAEEGDYVKKGNLIASLDLEEIEAKVKQAENAFEKAKRDLQRVKNLYADSVATLEQRQDAETALELAEADLSIAQFNLRHSRIIAPVAGRILSKRIESQELVNPGQPAYILASAGTGDQIVKVGLADKDVVKVRTGDSATIAFDAFPDKFYKASVTEISEAANPRTGTYKVELTLAGTYHQDLKNGMVASVELFTRPDSSYYKIPMSALVEADRKTATVYLTEDQKTATKKELQIAELLGDYFTVNSQRLNSPTWIVIEGASYLNDQDSIIAINLTYATP